MALTQRPRTPTLAGMTRRRLHLLLVTVSVDGGYKHLYIGPGRAPLSNSRPVGRSRWGDVEAGDEIEWRNGPRGRVAWVVVEQADPPSENGKIVRSGRAWLAGE